MSERAADERLRAWLVTGPLGRGLAFAIDFARRAADDAGAAPVDDR